jgi:GNAT superfamily N-acetyltransferase
MKQLRAGISEKEFHLRVARQRREGYVLAFVEDRGEVVAVAGYRIGHCLAWGKFLYVDYLVTDGTNRSRGVGDRLYRWLVEQARSHRCHQLHLDSGVQRFGAHKFYLNHGMEIRSHHFSFTISPEN